MADTLPSPARPLPALRAPRWARMLVAAAFLASLGWFCALTFLGRGLHRTVSRSEKRALAPAPGWPRSLGALAAFPARGEAWMNDHFFLRDWLVGCHSFLELRLLDRSTRPDVVVGQRGWLFYNIGGTLDDQRGMLRFTPAELAFMRAYLTARRDWFARRHIAYAFVVAPDKHTIYPEYLPAWRQRKRRAGTELDQFLAAMNRPGDPSPPLTLIDLRPALLQARQAGQVYLRTDTHWNEAGGRAGADVIRAWLQGHAPGPLPSVPCGPPELLEDEGGDLAAQLGLARVLRERAPLWPSSPEVVQPPWLAPGLEAWQPACALYNNADDGAQLHLLCFHDSFGDAMKDSLAAACAESLFLPRTPTMHHASLDLLRLTLDDFHPDVVVEEVIERNLGNYFFGDPAMRTERVRYEREP